MKRHQTEFVVGQAASAQKLFVGKMFAWIMAASVGVCILAAALHGQMMQPINPGGLMIHTLPPAVGAKPNAGKKK